MATTNAIIPTTTLNSIANAIKAKDSGGNMTAAQMADRIAAIPAQEAWTVKSWKLDGADHIWVRFPAGRYPERSVGLRYTIYCESGATVSWGDGSTSSVSASTSSGKELNASHTYSADGDYEITISGHEGIKAIGELRYLQGAIFNESVRQIEWNKLTTLSSTAGVDGFPNLYALRIGSALTAINGYLFKCQNLRQSYVDCSNVTTLANNSMFSDWNTEFSAFSSLAAGSHSIAYLTGLTKFGGFPNDTTMFTTKGNISLAEIGSFNSGVTAWSGSFLQGTQIETMPSTPNVTTLPDYALFGAYSLKRIEDISAVTSIVKSHYNIPALVYVGFPSKTSTEVMTITGWDLFGTVRGSDCTYHCSDGDFIYSGGTLVEK